jgi:hypothetical protein
MKPTFAAIEKEEEMGFDLHRGKDYINFNIWNWPNVLRVAFEFGWKPAGTVAPANFEGKWEGSYFTNGHQLVTDPDAQALAAALFRAVDAERICEPLNAGQTEALEKVNFDLLLRLAVFARERGFTIS